LLQIHALVFDTKSSSNQHVSWLNPMNNHHEITMTLPWFAGEFPTSKPTQAHHQNTMTESSSWFGTSAAAAGGAAGGWFGGLFGGTDGRVDGPLGSSWFCES
jgi:hypothetical protein